MILSFFPTTFLLSASFLPGTNEEVMLFLKGSCQVALGRPWDSLATLTQLLLSLEDTYQPKSAWRSQCHSVESEGGTGAQLKGRSRKLHFQWLA